MTRFLLALCALCVALQGVCGQVSYASNTLVNENVVREIDLRDSVAKHTYTITLKNTGDKSVSRFHLALPTELYSRIGFLEVTDSSRALCKVSKAESDGKVQHFKVVFSKPIEGGKSSTFTLMAFVGHAFKPLPTTASIKGPHLVQYFDSLLFVSPYKTETQKTTVKLPSGANVEQRTPRSSSEEDGSDVKFGPYKGSAPYSRGVVDAKDNKEVNELMVHFAHNTPLVYFKSVNREIAVSHWGSVSFHESYDVFNEAAGLNEEFNRILISHLQAQATGKFGVKRPQTGRFDSHILFAMDAVLPRTAFGLEYFDKIGNVSTSNARRERTGHTSLVLEPRYPLLGQYAADWEMTYSVPTRNVLFVEEKHPERHHLNVTFNPPFLNTFTDSLTTRVVLPAGAYNVKLTTPREVDAEWTEHKWGWFDVFQSRPVVAFTLRNFYIPESETQNMSYKMTVTYDYSGTSHLQKPLTLSLYFFAFFAAYIFFGRFESKKLSQGVVGADKKTQ